MERYYFTKHFNLENLTQKLLRYFEKELAEYSRRKSWFALSTDKKSHLLVVMLEGKADNGFKYAVMDLVSLEKSLDDKLVKSSIRLEMPIMRKPLVFEGKYMFCVLQGWSLEIGLIEQEKPCQTAEEAKKFIEAYAFCENLYPSINQYAWGKECSPQKGKLDGEEVFYLDIDKTTLVVGTKCHELWGEEVLIRD